MPLFRYFLAVSATTTFLISRLARTYLLKDSLTTTFLSVFGLQFFAWAVWRVILYPKFFSPYRHLPSPPGGSFLMGHFLSNLPETTGEPMRRWVEEVPNDGIIRYLGIFNVEILLITGPKALGEMLVTKAYDFVKPPQLASGVGRIFGIGVFLAEGEEHKRQRKILSPAFAFRHIKELYPIFWDKSKELVETVIEEHKLSAGSGEKPSQEGVDICGWARRVTLDVIGLAGLGQDFNSVKDPSSELYQTYYNLFQPSLIGRAIGIINFFFPTWLMRFIPKPRDGDLDAASQVIERNCYSLVASAKQRTSKTGQVEKNILSVALQSGDFSDTDLVHQLMTFLIAGHETTASAFAWTICMLCAHPAMQARLRAEIRCGLPDPRSPHSTITHTAVDSLAYLHAICNETLRLYAPVPLTIRFAARDTSLLDVPIPQGKTLFVAPWAVNVDTALWGPDAREFNPERWMGPGRANSGGVDSNFAYMTFLQGPRSCIGQGFATGELACLVAAWVGVFGCEFARADYVVKVRNELTPRPADLRVRLEVLPEW